MQPRVFLHTYAICCLVPCAPAGTEIVKVLALIALQVPSHIATTMGEGALAAMAQEILAQRVNCQERPLHPPCSGLVFSLGRGRPTTPSPVSLFKTQVDRLTSYTTQLL